MAPYVSWVLLLSFAAALSAFMFAWMTTQVEISTSTIEERTDTATCDDISVSVDEACQNTQTLNINVTNVRLLTVNGLKFRFFDLYDNTELRSINITIRPGDTQTIEVIKQGTLKQAEIIPFTKQDDKIITCTVSMTTLENIQIC